MIIAQTLTIRLEVMNAVGITCHYFAL